MMASRRTRCRPGGPPTIEIEGATYAVIGQGTPRVLLRVLADGTPGPAVGHLRRDGVPFIDHTHDEWAGELLTATLPCTSRAGVALPPSVREAIARGAAAEWRHAMPADELARCRAELEQLNAEGLLQRRNHAQATSLRGDRIGFITLDGAYCEHCECPALRAAFALLEGAGAQLADALGCGRLLTPPFGMVATYDGKQGYVRHLDNEPATEQLEQTAAARASTWRNFRVLTAICYLNDTGWSAARDGGALRCFDGSVEGKGRCCLEVEPVGGTIVFFSSCVVPHEVMPARKPRSAITLWFVSPALLRGTPEERAAAHQVVIPTMDGPTQKTTRTKRDRSSS
jgi:hypothetical protein